jgi:energy-coupling factor transporter ATP-binding protein EcfA2
MSGKAILLVGARGTGKSTRFRELISKAHPNARLLYDVNGEHKDLYPYPLLGFNEFTDLGVRSYDAVIGIEEATIFLPTRGENEDVKNFMVKARHRRNTIIMCFHSFRLVPRYIFDLSDYVEVFKTADSESLIESKFESPELVEVFKRIQAAPWNVNKDNGKRFSPRETFSIY